MSADDGVTILELRAIAQRHAEEVQRETRAPFTVVILADVEKEISILGAWVPDVEILQLILEQVRRSMSQGRATIVDHRTEKRS